VETGIEPVYTVLQTVT